MNKNRRQFLQTWCSELRGSRWWASGVVLAAVSFAGLAGMSPASAASNLIYSFESDLQSFMPNGGGVTISQSVIGATEGSKSMKVDIVAGATFVGALTTDLPLEIGDPPGLDVVTFDLTITSAFAGTGFVDAGITIFGASQPDYPNGPLFGLQAQFIKSQAKLADLTPGTYPIRMELNSATHPLTFAVGASFNDIFGYVGSGPDDLVPSGFQIYINKSNTAPWTGYIDNVRVIGYDADFNNDGAINSADLTIWKSSLGPSIVGDADCDHDTDGNDLLVWQRRLGPTGFVAAVAEPASAGLAAAALLALLGRRAAAVRLAANR